MTTDKKKVGRARTATRFIFLVCGLGMASWAPMVPLAKERLHLNEAGLGVILLMLGAGAIVMMPVAGFFVHRFGSRVVMLASGLLMAAALPLLMLAGTPLLLGTVLFFFGAGVGAIDVSMNAHAVVVQNLYGKHILSSFHGLFSIGGLFGSLGLGFLIKTGLSAGLAAWCISGVLVLILLFQYRWLLLPRAERSASEPPATPGKNTHGKMLWAKPSVLFIGLMCFVLFLAEGAMLDWSALFLRDHRRMDASLAGSGYAAFSIAMALMRLLGDGLVEKFSPRKIVLWGTMVAASGFMVAVLLPWAAAGLLGFVLIGLGAANTVPVFFSAAGKIPGVPPAIALPAVTTIGYTGQLAGPALLGFVAYEFSLPIALGFTGIAIFLAGLAFFVRKAAKS
ncbi:MFS transporter [Pedobacter sp. SYP-B3415]|uniref:MFS transporter n=1 Tax=Pedobacter sp. SYP-B3415 TaxID=2496641 RepID=UPI00101D0D52|nr:MFS transporter [Pedobacter sp. SYP-B3415]